MKNLFNAYVNYCNTCEAKRDAARKASREAHPVFYGIMDAISAIITIIGIIMMIYSAIQWVAEKANQFKRLIHKAVIKTKFDRDRYEPIDDPADDTDTPHEA
jgi:hypothetical protein